MKEQREFFFLVMYSSKSFDGKKIENKKILRKKERKKVEIIEN